MELSARRKLYQKAVAMWGGYAHSNMLIEECAELIVAIRHFDRGKATIDEVASELADVKIMIDSITQMLGISLDKVIDVKLMRLKATLEGKGEED